MQRPQFQSLAATPFDLIIIGGGITGAALAHQAAAQQLNVALFEMNDFGSATSSATSKLIHGGLRYLKNKEFRLVRESLRERRTIGTIAPNLVEPLQFIIPAYGQSRASRMALKAGMVLYDLLSFDKRHVPELNNRLASHQTCSSQQMLSTAPILREEGLGSGVSFYDYANINPDRMTWAFLKTAVDNGAKIANYARVTQLERKANRISGVQVLDQCTGQSHTVHSSWVVNCTGAWVDEVLRHGNSVPPQHRTRSEGVHLITSKIPIRSAVVLQTESGEHLIFLPWRGLTIVGPTDRAFEGSPSEYRPSRASLDELIEKINRTIPAEKMGCKFTRQDILFHYGGLRPLIDVDSHEGTYSASRRYEIVDHQERDGLSGLISVEGGKYTTSRGLAEATLAVIAKRANWNVHRVDTRSYVLHCCRVGDTAKFLKSLLDRFGEHYPSRTIEYYARNYGLEAPQILELGLQKSDGRVELTSDGEIMAEVDYVLEEEMVITLSDLMLRRTGVGWMGRPPESLLQTAATKLGDQLNWTKQQRQQAIDDFVEQHYTLP